MKHLMVERRYLWSLRVFGLALIAMTVWLTAVASYEGVWIYAAINAALAGLNLVVAWFTWIVFQPRVDPYRDKSCPPRLCDHCGKIYRGPAVYCSLRCAIGDAA